MKQEGRKNSATVILDPSHSGDNRARLRNSGAGQTHDVQYPALAMLAAIGVFNTFLLLFAAFVAGVAARSSCSGMNTFSRQTAQVLAAKGSFT